MRREGLTGFDLLLLVGGAAAAVLAAVVWAGAWTAAALDGHQLHAHLHDVFAAAFNLARHAGSPRDAWPVASRAALPGPVVYWLATAVVACITITVIAL